MLDDKTRKELRRMQDKINSDGLAGNLVEKHTDTVAEDIVKDVMKSPKMSDKERKGLQNLIDKGAFRHEQTRISESKQKELDKRWDRAIQDGLKSGKIKKADTRGMQDIWRRNQEKFGK